ncbi:hypothetical protein SAMN05444678_10973 [Sphingomonas sp. YR710]|nr:hypothetical protein SAMN05444678_10973 [Sphingomonas sp. YR710]
MRSLAILLWGAASVTADAAEHRSAVYGKPSEALAVQAVHNFAKCIVDRTPQGAEKVLAMDFRTKEYSEALRTLARGHEDHCLNGGDRMRSNRVLLAGGLAEALLNAKGVIAHLARATAYDPTKPPIESRALSETISICIVREEPGKVANLFGTEPASEAENRATQALGGTLVKCVPSGKTMKMNRPALRALLALAAYRAAQNNSPATTPASGS